MKSADQLITDMTGDRELSERFREGLNRLRGDETLDVMQAGVQVARDLGYEVSESEAKDLVTVLQGGMPEEMNLSDDMLKAVAGGKYDAICPGDNICDW